jgi:hypothetical protein
MPVNDDGATNASGALHDAGRVGGPLGVLVQAANANAMAAQAAAKATRMMVSSGVVVGRYCSAVRNARRVTQTSVGSFAHWPMEWRIALLTA